MLDSEEWRAAEVPRELQEAVDAVLAQGQGQDNKKPDKPKRAGKLFFLVFKLFRLFKNFIIQYPHPNWYKYRPQKLVPVRESPYTFAYKATLTM